MKFAILFITLASAATAYASLVVTVPGKAVPSTALEVIIAEDQSALNQVALQFNGARPGLFPALVDKRTGLWVTITGTVVEAQAELDVKLNEDKPAEQKAAENAFFTLTETILATVSDPRAGQTPPVKLSFSEINALIKTIQATDPMAAINFSLELLAVDAELKRFDILWWDKASTHVIPQE